VTWPTATASRSCRSFSQPSRATRSARRNANRTHPLPNGTEPIFTKTNRRGQSPIGVAPAAAAAAIAACAEEDLAR
jgi:hypothetical protein